jgi:hypothetical protein
MKNNQANSAGSGDSSDDDEAQDPNKTHEEVS